MTIIIDETKSKLESEYASLVHNANTLKNVIDSIKVLIKMNTIKDSQKTYVNTLQEAEKDYSILCVKLSYLRDKIK